MALQPAIDRLALDAMGRFNRGRAVVLNTYQCYLRDSLGRVEADLERARRAGTVFGAKVVRGAYVVQVRRGGRGGGGRGGGVDRIALWCGYRTPCCAYPGDMEAVCVCVGSHSKQSRTHSRGRARRERRREG